MRRFWLFAVLTMALALPAAAEPHSPKSAGKESSSEKEETPTFKPPKDGVLVHLTCGFDKPKNLLMALQLAVQTGADENRDVCIYADIDGYEVFLKDAENIAHDHRIYSAVVRLLQDINVLGVEIYVSPFALQANNRKPDDLAPGIKIAKRDEIFSFTKGRILTMTY